MEKAEVRDYLDSAIQQWRIQRDTATDEHQRQMCCYYIDAFQSVRVSLIGSVLGEPKLTEKQRQALRYVVEAYENEMESGDVIQIRKEDIDVLRELLLED